MDEDRQKTIELLNTQYSWPAPFPFKFIMPASEIENFSRIFPNITPQTRFSKNAKYISISFDLEMSDAEAVLAIYQKAKAIKGLLAL